MGRRLNERARAPHLSNRRLGRGGWAGGGEGQWRASACAVAARGGGWARAAPRGRGPWGDLRKRRVTSFAALRLSERPRSGPLRS